ncbi:hypothetical protein, partial [Okeania sp. SIO3B5]|uniref:hypothetical protein n=1 Tax=Okeania sp. SIO3B5 TaxID=2607811 RepID=UPI0025F9CB49
AEAKIEIADANVSSLKPKLILLAQMLAVQKLELKVQKQMSVVPWLNYAVQKQKLVVQVLM